MGRAFSRVALLQVVPREGMEELGVGGLEGHRRLEGPSRLREAAEGVEEEAQVVAGPAVVGQAAAARAMNVAASSYFFSSARSRPEGVLDLVEVRVRGDHLTEERLGLVVPSARRSRSTARFTLAGWKRSSTARA